MTLLGGENVAGFLGGGDRVVLLVKVDLEERQVMKNWSGGNMCLVGIQVDHSLGFSVFSIVCFRRRNILHEIPRTLRYHHHQLQV